MELPLSFALEEIGKCIVVSIGDPRRKVKHRDLCCRPAKQGTEGGRARSRWLILWLSGTYDANRFDDSGVKGKRFRGKFNLGNKKTSALRSEITVGECKPRCARNAGLTWIGYGENLEPENQETVET